MFASARLSKRAQIVPDHAALMHAYRIITGQSEVSARIVAIEQPRSSATFVEAAL
jgi:hypothetical protein